MKIFYQKIIKIIWRISSRERSKNTVYLLSIERLLDRLLIFSHSNLNYENSPPNLKETIKLSYNSTNYKEIDQYNFRQWSKAKKIFPLQNMKFWFFAFFPRLISKLTIVNYTLESQAFKVQISLVSKEIQKKIIQYFPRFDIAYHLLWEKGWERKKEII